MQGLSTSWARLNREVCGKPDCHVRKAKCGEAANKARRILRWMGMGGRWDGSILLGSSATSQYICGLRSSNRSCSEESRKR
jgi:hypothetical protein